MSSIKEGGSKEVPNDLFSQDVDRMRFAMNAAGIGIWEVDLASSTVIWDDRCRELFGLKKDNNISYQDAIRFIHPDDMLLVDNAVQAALLGEQKGRYDIIYRTIGGDDGQLRWVHFSGQAYIDDAGNIKRFGGIAQEATARILAEQEAEKLATQARMNANLEENEARFRSLFEQSPMAIGLLRGRDMIIEVGNEQIFELWGKDASIIGQPILDALPEIKGQIFISLLEDVYDTGKPFYGTGTLAKLVRAGHLEEVYFDFTYTPVRDTTEQIIGVMVLATEVTARETARKAIEESQRRLWAMFEESPVAIATISADEHLAFETANAFYATLVGRWPEELLGKPLLEALPEIKGQGFDQILKEVITSGRPFVANEAPADLQRAGRMERVYVNLTFQPLREAEGRISGILMVAVDVTAQVVSRQRISESEARFRALIEEAPIATCLFVGREMRIDIANPAMIEVWGKGDGVMGKPLTEALPELKDQHFPALLDELFTTGKSFSAKGGRADLVKDGQLKTFYFDYDFKPLRNTAGDVYAILETAIDVTEPVLARKMLEESEQFVRTIFYSSPVAKLVFVGPDMVCGRPMSRCLESLAEAKKSLASPLWIPFRNYRPRP